MIKGTGFPYLLAADLIRNDKRVERHKEAGRWGYGLSGDAGLCRNSFFILFDGPRAWAAT